MRLIDADALPVKHGIDMGSNYGGLRAVVLKRDIDDAPTVDAEPIRHGHWLPHPNPEYREWDVCSSCGTGCKRREYHVDFMTKMEWERQVNYLYCPNCGAKMDEVEDEVS